MEMKSDTIRNLSELGPRGAFGAAMTELGGMIEKTVVVTADLADATRVRDFSRRYPERFFQVGLAEQNMIGIAAGLALNGKTAFVTTFACFASMRCLDQVRTDVAYMDLDVKVVGADAGLVMGTLGTTHYAQEDLAIYRGIPNMTILSPADGLEVYKSTIAAAERKGPVYLRLTGGNKNPIVYNEDYRFEIGRAVTLREGRTVSLIATGTMVYRALEAARILETMGISARVIDMHAIKPIDVAAIETSARETELIVSLEEHSVLGGLGGAVAETLSGICGAPPLLRIGIPDKFVQISTYPTMIRRLGLDPENIAEKVRSILAQGLQNVQSRTKGLKVAKQG